MGFRGLSALWPGSPAPGTARASLAAAAVPALEAYTQNYPETRLCTSKALKPTCHHGTEELQQELPPPTVRSPWDSGLGRKRKYPKYVIWESSS